MEYFDGWKPGDKAIYSDFGLRSLYIVEVLPWPEHLGYRVGSLIAGSLYLPPVMHDWREGSVRAKIIDTSLAEWDFPWRNRPLEPWKQVSTIHYYDSGNLYRSIHALMRHKSRTTRPDVQLRIARDLMNDPGWPVFRRYGLASPS